MKVLHLIPSLSGGGAERQLSMLAVHQSMIGWEVHIAVERAPERRLQQATIHHLHTKGVSAVQALEIIRLIRELRPSVVQTWLTKMDILGGCAARITRVPWIMSERSCDLAYPSNLKHRVRSLLARLSSGIVANSAAGVELWSRAVPRTFFIPNGLDIAAIDAAVASTAIVPTSFTPFLLYAGRLDTEKNIKGACAALRAVLECTSANVVICGDGPDRSYVEAELADAIRDERVLITGFTSEIWNVMKSASALVAFSRFEGRPNTVLEAMACRCPVILSDIPAHREIANDASAWFVPLEDPAAVARVATELLAGGEPVATRVAAARQQVAGMSIEAAAHAYTEVYRSLMARN